MGKGLRAFVLVYSVILVALFCVFCYLMTTVNPDPVFLADQNDTTLLVEDTPTPIERGILRYGLEKIDSFNDTPYTAKTESPYIIFIKKHKVTKVTETIFKSSDNWVLETPRTVTIERINDHTEMARIKKGKRRSVNENINSNSESAGVVILKIVDDTGNTKIEIKVEPDVYDDNDLKDMKYFKSYKNKRGFENRDTVIKILPNNTLSVDKLESPLMLDLASKNKIVSKKVTESVPEIYLTNTDNTAPNISPLPELNQINTNDNTSNISTLPEITNTSSSTLNIFIYPELNLTNTNYSTANISTLPELNLTNNNYSTPNISTSLELNRTNTNYSIPNISTLPEQILINTNYNRPNIFLLPELYRTSTSSSTPNIYTLPELNQINTNINKTTPNISTLSELNLTNMNYSKPNIVTLPELDLTITDYSTPNTSSLPELNGTNRNYSTPNISISSLHTLKNDKLIIISATNSTEKYSTNSIRKRNNRK